jgi:hypothetical protein
MTVLIQDFETGDYLKRFDPEFANGRGAAWWTDDPAKAMRFEDSMAAFQFWKTQSTTRPIREDGKPNRPLTAHTVTIEKAPP